MCSYKMLSLIILLLIITTNFHEISAGCPVRCDCAKNSVTCVSKSLDFVPYLESLTNNPVIIDLSGNNILSIENADFSFDKSDQVIEIYLNKSNINSIEGQAFEELVNLQELYLAENLLTQIPDGFVEKNVELIVLDMSSNYFQEMPKIKSNSLEVLAMANSKIAQVPDGALDYLPNLKILLLLQNNLKALDSGIFHSVHNLFFIQLAHNPWHCDCKTTQLFDYLTENNFTKVDDPIQCQNSNKNFIDIYNSQGVTNKFSTQCGYYPIIDDNFLADEYVLMESESEPENTERKQPDEVLDDNLIYWYLLVFVAIPLSLALGVIIGTCATYRVMSIQMSRLKMESTKELLAHQQGIY